MFQGFLCYLWVQYRNWSGNLIALNTNKHHIISLAWYLHKMISPSTSWKELSAQFNNWQYFWSYEVQTSTTSLLEGRCLSIWGKLSLQGSQMMLIIFRGQAIIQRWVKFFHGKHEFRVFISSPEPFTLEIQQMAQ